MDDEYRVYYKDKQHGTWTVWNNQHMATLEEAEKVYEKVKALPDVYDVFVKRIEDDADDLIKNCQ